MMSPKFWDVINLIRTRPSHTAFKHNLTRTTAVNTLSKCLFNFCMLLGEKQHSQVRNSTAHSQITHAEGARAVEIYQDVS